MSQIMIEYTNILHNGTVVKLPLTILTLKDKDVIAVSLKVIRTDKLTPAVTCVPYIYGKQWLAVLIKNMIEPFEFYKEVQTSDTIQITSNEV